jgi:hypothetical protein
LKVFCTVENVTTRPELVFCTGEPIWVVKQLKPD